jgi:predicted ATP-dependent endonuclease of OLD family
VQPQSLSFDTSTKLTKALKIINPQITDIRLTSAEGGLSVILDNKRSISLETIGNGAVLWVSALIKLFDVIEISQNIQNITAKYRHAFIIIDEIGAGLHCSVLLDMWKYLCELTKTKQNIQFIFSSHSDDCIHAYCQAFSSFNDAKIVRLHRTIGDNKIVVTEFSNDMFESISKGEWEVRG